MAKNKGFTFIEVVIAAAIFFIFAFGVYQGFAAIYGSITATRHKALAADLANAQFEIIKNMPYSSVGTVGGNPNGILTAVQSIVNDSLSFVVTTTIVNVDDPFDGLSGSGDLFPNDYKLVELKIDCAACKKFVPLFITGRVAPKNLES